MQNILASDILENLNIITDDISIIEYSYSNPELDENDLTTWRYLDLLILNKTGSLPTTKSPYKSYIYNDGSTLWFLIKDLKKGLMKI